MAVEQAIPALRITGIVLLVLAFAAAVGTIVQLVRNPPKTLKAIIRAAETERIEIASRRPVAYVAEDAEAKMRLLELLTAPLPELWQGTYPGKEQK